MKREILQRSTELFLERGFKIVTMDDIATEMGISKKTIYQYYKSKPELIEATSNYLNETIAVELDKIKQMNLDAVSQIIQAHQHIDTIFNVKNSAPLFQLNKYYPKIAALNRSYQLQRFDSIIQENLRKGIQAGLYRSEINIAFFSRLYFSSCLGLYDEVLFPEDLFSYQIKKQLHLEYFLRSVVTERGLEVLQKQLANYPTNEV